MGLKKTHGVSASDFTGIDPCRKQPIYIYIYTYSQYTKDQSQSKHIHKNLNLECYFLGVFFLLASRSCAISQFRPMRDDIHCVDPLTTSNFWMPEMVWRLHIRFFVFFPYVPTCSNMFQHVPTCSIWHLHSHALTLKGFTAAESQAPWGQGNVEPSAESRAPGHNVAEWLPAPGTRPFDVNVFHGKSEKSHG